MCLVTKKLSAKTKRTRGEDDEDKDDEKENDNFNMPSTNNSRSPARLGRHGAGRLNRKAQLKQRQQEQQQQQQQQQQTPTSSSSIRKKAARSKIWLLLVAGTCWSMFTLHKSIGHEDFSGIMQKEMEQESKYLATLFKKVSRDAREVLLSSGQVVMSKSLLSSPSAAGSDVPAAKVAATAAVVVGSDTDGVNNNNNLRQLSSNQEQQQQQDQQPPPPAEQPLTAPAATPLPNQHSQHQHQPAAGIDFSHLHSRQHHAFVIPYRDRKFHLEQFIEHMGPYLKRNFPDESFEIWLIEQDDTFLFNRAWLANVGIANIQLQNKDYKHQLAQQQDALWNHNGETTTTTKRPITVPPPPRCIILHDVDLIPTVDGVPYTNCSRPIQLGSELAHFNNSIPYPIYTGGVGPSMLLEHWTRMNGMSNDFFGWGGEDDDLWHRLRLTGLLKKPARRPTPAPRPDGKPYKGPKFWPPEIQRPPKGLGKFRPISEAETVHHNDKSHNQWNRIGYMLELMQNNSARWKKDGLADLKMTITGDATTITHLDSIENSTAIHTDPTVLYTSRATTTTLTKKHYITAKQPGSIISSLSIEPTALASFAAIHHIKAIPKLTALEFIHVTQTDGSRIERAGAKAGIAWGACHYKHALEKEFGCPDIAFPEWEGRAKMHDGRTTHDPWHSPLQDFEENPFGGRPTFAVVRNPYQRLIEYFYCPWNGYKGEDINRASLNRFIQNALFPKVPKTDKKKKKDEKDPPPPPSPAFLHLRPQFHYIFANNKIARYSKPFVTHVLRYESLEEDFNNLMHMYKLDHVKLPTSPLKEAPPRPVVLTQNDFDDETLRQIHRFYAGDFGRFRYRQIPVKAPVESPSVAKTTEAKKEEEDGNRPVIINQGGDTQQQQQQQQQQQLQG